MGVYPEKTGNVTVLWLNFRKTYRMEERDHDCHRIFQACGSEKKM